MCWNEIREKRNILLYGRIDFIPFVFPPLAVCFYLFLSHAHSHSSLMYGIFIIPEMFGNGKSFWPQSPPPPMWMSITRLLIFSFSTDAKTTSNGGHQIRTKIEKHKSKSNQASIAVVWHAILTILIFRLSCCLSLVLP